jgi:hypothetical protein
MNWNVTDTSVNLVSEPVIHQFKPVHLFISDLLKDHFDIILPSTLLILVGHFQTLTLFLSN